MLPCPARMASLSSLGAHALCLQAQPLHERTARESVLEPLIRVAEAHQGGMEEYARNVVKELFDAFLRTEERFAGKLESTDQEVIDSMRTVQVVLLQLAGSALACFEHLGPLLEPLANAGTRT